MRREDARTRTIVLRRIGLCATILNCLVLQAMTQQSERVHWLDRGKAARSKHSSTVDGSAKPHTWWFESYVSLHNSIRNGTSPPRYVVWTCGPLSQVAERRHNSDASPGPEQDSPWMKEDIFDAPSFPHDVPRDGSRPVPFSREIWIERGDFMETPQRFHREILQRHSETLQTL